MEAQENLDPITGPLAEAVEQVIAQTGLPSVSIAIVRDGVVAWAGAYGFANLAAQVPATTGSYYSAGSTFKLATATAVMQLVQKGSISLDTALNEVLGPELAIDGADNVTVRHLLAHRSGLDAFSTARRINPVGPVSTVPLWSRRDFIAIEDVIRNTRPATPPGESFSYCNDCYGILGYVVERLSGQTFDEYVADHVLRPLGVEIETPSVPTPRVVERMALPYDVSSGRPSPVHQVRYDLAAAGDVYLTATDMARFLAAQMNDCRSGEVRLLSVDSCRELRRQQFEGRPYGLGISLARVRDRELITHSGSIPGFSSFMVGEPASKQGVYVMANGFGADGALSRIATRYTMQLLWESGGGE
ncbi:MAG: beta-lactamase family protein [Thermoanaerobaculia bacterium]|nr:beta-lactamase family protein [Thermoanaerobaculia bacterium]